MQPNLIARATRGLAIGFPLIAGVSHLDAQSAFRAGRYEFVGIAPGNRDFQGVVHVTSVDGLLGGRLVSNIIPSIPFTRVTPRADGVDIVGDLGDGRTLMIKLEQRGDSLVGGFSDGSSTGPIRSRFATARGEDPNELRPVPCRVSGTTEIGRCATHWVYEDRARRVGRRIPLSIIVLPALGEPRAADPLFHFAGGPGESATSQASGNAQRFATIRKMRDVVMIDQRGTGGSNELTCQFNGSRERASLLLGGVFPADQLAACRSTLERRADLRLYRTDVAAQDVDDVREWLGYDRINVYGGSYGTRAALAYMRQFPDRVRTATLRAVQSPGSSILDGPRDAQASLDRVFAECAAEAPCAMAFPNLRAEFDSVLARIVAQPVTLRVFDGIRKDTVDIPLTRGAFAGSIRRLLMDANGALQVPLAVHQAAAGDWSILRVGLVRTLGISADIAWGMMASVVCSEDPPIVRRADVDRATRGTFYGDVQIRSALTACANWPVSAPAPGYDQPVRVSVPTLLLSGELDPTTPVRMGEATANALPSSVHVVLPGISHGPFPQCAVDIMAAFVAAGTVSGLDTACVKAMRRAPFVVSR